MTPGEIITGEGDITLNADRRTVTLLVRNTADRPIQVGSHYHLPRPTPPWVSTGRKHRACG